MTATNPIRSYQQFIEGLQIIEREVIKQVRDFGGQLDARNFRWHRGKDLLPPPSAIELEIRTPRRTVNATFSREEVEDSWDRLGRADVHSKVRDIVEELTKL